MRESMRHNKAKEILSTRGLTKTTIAPHRGQRKKKKMNQGCEGTHPERERDREINSERKKEIKRVFLCVERERERQGEVSQENTKISKSDQRQEATSIE